MAAISIIVHLSFGRGEETLFQSTTLKYKSKFFLWVMKSDKIIQLQPRVLIKHTFRWGNENSRLEQQKHAKKAKTHNHSVIKTTASWDWLDSWPMSPELLIWYPQADLQMQKCNYHNQSSLIWHKQPAQLTLHADIMHQSNHILVLKAAVWDGSSWVKALLVLQRCVPKSPGFTESLPALDFGLGPQ